MHRIFFEVSNLVLHAAAIHRGGSQAISTVRRFIYASQLTAKPRILEWVNMVEIQAPENALGCVYSTELERGHVFDQMQRPGTQLYNIKAYLPVIEPFRFSSTLRATASGQAFPQCAFDHSNMLGFDPMEVSHASKLVSEIKRREDLKEQMTRLSQFEDKL